MLLMPVVDTGKSLNTQMVELIENVEKVQEAESMDLIASSLMDVIQTSISIIDSLEVDKSQLIKKHLKEVAKKGNSFKALINIEIEKL